MKGSCSEARTLGSVVRSSFRDRWPQVRRFDFDPRCPDPFFDFGSPVGPSSGNFGACLCVSLLVPSGFWID